MAIIKLSGVERDWTENLDYVLKYYPIWINTNHIVSFYQREEDDGTALETLFDVRGFVKETPEEILALIKEAENGK